MDVDSEDEEKRGRMGIFVPVFLVTGLGIFLFLKNSPDNPEVPVREATTSVDFGEIDPDAGVEESPEEALKTLGVGVSREDPEALMNGIAEFVRAGDYSGFASLVGEKGLTEEQASYLAELIKGGRVELASEGGVREVGELEINRRSRWALLTKGENRFFFDLLRKEDGTWEVERVSIPEALATETVQPKETMTTDALGVSDAFLQAVLRQDFELAKTFVAEDGVSNARIAGLCIIFEEGEYQMRKDRPLRGLFIRGDSAGFLANVEDREGQKAAQFGITLQRDGEGQRWQIKEINLDQLLADYADRVADGDVHYAPLVKNPNGGDTIVLYFDFDEEKLESRSERQLDIVVGLLKLDPEKQIRIAGHTDGFGSEEYNKELSEKRAQAVKDFLISNGVPIGQVSTEALGQSDPRLPNTTGTGEDNPEGRRVNRRTEIYLDF